MSMETSPPLYIESFSHSWLTNTKFSFDGQNEPLRTSNRFLEEAENFNFDFASFSELSSSLVHADEIFSNGKILPIYRDDPYKEEFTTSGSFPSTPISSISLRTNFPADRIRSHFLMKWMKSSKKILHKYFGLLKPLCLKVGCSRESIKVDDFDRKYWEMRSLDSSPPQNREFLMCDWSDIKGKRNNAADFDREFRKPKSSWSDFSTKLTPAGEWTADSSISDAILHCKRSFEN